MKKYINISLAYALGAMAGGVFYREFTKWMGFNGITALGKIHTHLFMLGMVIFLLISQFVQCTALEEEKMFRIFLWVYNIGTPLTASMLLVRGIIQVLGITLTSGQNAAISGIAGIGHILTGIGLVLLMLALRKACARGPRAVRPGRS